MSSYDIEDESILSTVFKDAFPDSWRGNAEFGQYLSELSSYGVEKLNREPDRLAEERAQILEQTQDLAFHNYKTFIQTAECSKEIFQDFQVIERHVDALLAKLPKLNKECAQFLKEAQEINSSRKMNSMTLQRHTQLLEILEMPQLMDTCVRNGYYEEALELAAHVKRLEKKHSHIPVIMNIVNEVKNSSQLMLSQLIHQLRSNIQLPACLRVIGYLRRMDVFSEAELRIKFLQARDAWFQSILSNIPADDPYYHITKTVEASRVHLFDIITQYRAIFSDEDPLLITGKDDAGSEAALFHSWVVHKISQFLSVLQQDLQQGVGGRLDSILGQCMYFGLSFSRVGADFRGLLVPIFQRAVLKEFTDAMNMANMRFNETMQSYTLLGTLSAVPSSALALASQTGGGLQPPSSLLEFNPLAALCNDILMAFNELRLCAPLTLACDVSDLVQQSLVQACHCILDYHRAEESTFNSQEADKFSSFCRVFADDLVPFLNKCLQALFPPPQIAQILGLHLSELSKMGFIGVMDTAGIIQPMEHLLPVKQEAEPLIGQEDEVSEESAALIGQKADETDPTHGDNQSENVAQPALSEPGNDYQQKGETEKSQDLSEDSEVNELVSESMKQDNEGDDIESGSARQDVDGDQVVPEITKQEIKKNEAASENMKEEIKTDQAASETLKDEDDKDTTLSKVSEVEDESTKSSADTD